MLFDPSLNGLCGTVKFASNVCDGALLCENLFDGLALYVDAVARLFFRHGTVNGVKGILTKNRQNHYRPKNRKYKDGVRGTDTPLLRGSPWTRNVAPGGMFIPCEPAHGT